MAATTTTQPIATAGAPGASQFAQVWRNLRRSTPAMIGLTILLVHFVIALASPLLVPYSPTAMEPSQAFSPPSAAHPFGADRYGRDVLTRTLLGGRVALALALSSATVAVFLGGLIGVLLAYMGGMVDEVFMRIVDAYISIPGLLLLLVIVTTLGSGYRMLLLALVISYTPGVIRVARAAAQEFIPRDFITAARARGESVLAVVMRELWPNVLDVLLVEFAMRASWMVLAISGLSFLGFGVNPPTPDWGLMVNENRQSLAFAPWGILFPILAISTLVVGLNLVADGIAKAVGLDRSRGAPL
ncbi:MAG: peptide ABC transporter permease [Chloroflexi bacterium]|nr:MAG: peptide ABC transporter permease [Chloroflexota bacterium]